MSSDTSSWASARRFSGMVVAQRSHWVHMWRTCSRGFAPDRQPVDRGRAHLGLEGDVELVQQRRLRVEVDEQRPLETPASLAIAAVGAPSPWEAMTRVAADRIAFRRSSLRGLAASPTYKRVTSQSTYGPAGSLTGTLGSSKGNATSTSALSRSISPCARCCSRVRPDRRGSCSENVPMQGDRYLGAVVDRDHVPVRV